MDWPKSYKAKFIEAGLVNYEDNGGGVWLLRKEVLDKMLASFVGKPLLLNHSSEVTAANYSQHACGYVSRAWYNETDGWYWVDFLVTSHQAEQAIAQNFSVSCAYEVTKYNEGGLYHQCPYHYEVAEGQFIHLALVEAPRYEEAIILKNTLTEGGAMNFKRKKEETVMNNEAELQQKICQSYFGLAQRLQLKPEELTGNYEELLLKFNAAVKHQQAESQFIKHAAVGDEGKPCYLTRSDRKELGLKRYG
ncbi:MAG: DUF2213 domain-containing protein [Spirochaetaceae bacterium]|nr:DUF2213 domain-containing protein [Spirochaetaceae bacterium]